MKHSTYIKELLQAFVKAGKVDKLVYDAFLAEERAAIMSANWLLGYRNIRNESGKSQPKDATQG